MSGGTPRKVLTIAGSDSGGGAGVQADLKTFAALGAYGMSAITAITAQKHSLGVTAVQDISLDVIEAQIDAVVDDIGVDAVKTGMLSSPGILCVLVARKAEEYGFERLVVDPVMVAATGARLLKENAVEAVKQDLIPSATVVTPNTFEAEVLTGRAVTTETDMREAGEGDSRVGSPVRRGQGRPRAGIRPEHRFTVRWTGLHRISGDPYRNHEHSRYPAVRLHRP